MKYGIAAPILPLCWGCAITTTRPHTSTAVQPLPHRLSVTHYLRRSDRDVQTLKVITITDTELLAVLDLQCSVEWKHDTKLGPQVVQRNANDLLSVAADKDSRTR